MPGLTAGLTLQESETEIFVPLSRYAPSANFDPDSVEPVLLRLESREKDQSRVLSGRKVLLKQEKNGRFDMKPTTDRQESDVEQSIVPITVERLPGNVVKVSTLTELKRGEYGLVLRKKNSAGAFTSNVPLKPDAAPSVASAAPVSIPGLTPEMASMLTPEQLATVQQQMQSQETGPQQRGGMFSRMKRTTPAASAPLEGEMTGFLVWDFRVL